MKVTLIIKKSAKRNDMESKATVYARVRDGRRLDCTVSTMIEANPNLWDNSKGHLKDRIVIDKMDKARIDGEANNLVTFINNEYAKEKSPIDKDWIEMVIDKFYHPEKYEVKSKKTNLDLLPMFDYYMEMHPISEVRKKNYRVVRRILARYELYVRITHKGNPTYKLTLDDISPDTLQNMWIYFRDEHSYVEKYPELFEAVPETRQPKPRGLNTLIDYFRKIRSFMIWCYDNDFTTNRPFDKYHIEEPVYGSPVYITLEERNQLLKHDFSDNPRLEKYRDIFVFHSLIGCRVSDLWSMTKKSVVGDHIEYIAGKTIDNNPRTITVPLNAISKSILQKYTDYPGPALFPFGYQQDYNEDIKKVFKEVGLTRMVTVLNPTTRKPEQQPLCDIAASHMARRTFIGNLYKKVKDKGMVSMLSGHTSDSKAFDRYWTPDDDMRQSLVDMLV